MDTNYLSRIQHLVSLSTRRKTSNILEGGFPSVYRGRSLEFEDLRDYVFGDEVHDIDWKSSSRAGKALIRRYVAEKKQYVLFLCDSGVKMTADTSAGESKSDLCMMTFGVMAYLLDRQGADFAMTCAGRRGAVDSAFCGGESHIEDLIRQYRQEALQTGESDIGALAGAAVDRFHRHMVLVLITDLHGIAQLSERVIRKLTVSCDVRVVDLEDAYLTGANVFDVQRNRYVDDFFLASRALQEAERRERARLLGAAQALFRRYHVGLVTIARESEIVDRTIGLFREDEG